MNPLAFSGPEFLSFALATGALAAVVMIVARALITRAPRGVRWAEIAARIQPAEVAFLVGGAQRAVATAVAELHHRGVVTIRSGLIASSGVTSGELESEGGFRGVVAPARYTTLEEYVLSRLPAPLSELCGGIARTPIGAELAAKLEGDGLLVRRHARSRRLLRLPALAWLGLGLLKLCVGMANDRPTDRLFVLLLGGAVVFWFLGRLPRLTALGERALRELRHASLGLEETARTAPQQLGGTEMALAFALFGYAVAAPDLQLLLPHTAYGTGASSCGSGGCSSSGASGASGGDGGGGDGGGGGGCSSGGGCGGCGGGGGCSS